MIVRLGTAVILLAAVSIAVGQPGEHGAQEVVPLQDAPRLEGTVDLRIGQIEGEAPYLFGRITGTWPIGVDLSYGAIRGRTALGTTTAEVGVGRVVRIRFAPVEDA